MIRSMTRGYLGVVVVIGMLAGCSSSGVPSQITSPPDWGVLSTDCSEGPTALAGEVKAAYDDLRANGHPETYPQLEKHLAAAITIHTSDCSELIAAYLTLRDS